MVAMVLGTALSALGPAGLATAAPDATLRAVNDMSRYCTTCWRNARLHPDCWTDCTQEVFSRLLERVRPDAWGRVLQSEGEERREFLRAIDTVKKRAQRERTFQPLDRAAEVSAASSDGDPDRWRTTIQEAMARSLTPREKALIQATLQGETPAEIALRWGVAPKTVSNEKTRVIQKLRGVLVGDHAD